MLTIDGSFGEGGGQVLRTSLSLSAATGTPIRLENIRAGRKKPGLLRQHRTAVLATAQACSARVEGAELNSTTLIFEPGPIRAGNFEFSIGTAGSTTLVLQTLLPPLMKASGKSTVTLRGGTHNPMAPPFEFLQHSFLPQLRRLGVSIEGELVQPGFFPAGGGEIRFTLTPPQSATPLSLTERGEKLRHRGLITLCNLGKAIAGRERTVLAKQLGWPSEAVSVELVEGIGPGNTVSALLEYEHVTETITAFGRRHVSAERVANDAARAARAYLNQEAPIGEHLADQLLLPMALLGGGRFVTGTPSSHLRTNMHTIGRFLDKPIVLSELGDGRWQVTVATAEPARLQESAPSRETEGAHDNDHL